MQVHENDPSESRHVARHVEPSSSHKQGFSKHSSMFKQGEFISFFLNPVSHNQVYPPSKFSQTEFSEIGKSSGERHSFLSEQEKPSPKKPSLHEHSNPPGVFLHVEHAISVLKKGLNCRTFLINHRVKF